MLRDFTLLCVEDDSDAQHLIKLMFQEDVKELYLASNGQEGLDMYKIKQPDIVLTDINMPKMDGLELTKAIKKINPEQPVVLMSAHDDKENLIAAIEAGVNGFVTKPVDIDELFTKLNKIAYELYERKEAQNKKAQEIESLYKLAHYDDLTQIPNRFLFEILFKQAFNRVEENHLPLALFFIDIDNFKEINDTYGHQVGDKILQTLTDNIRKIIRSDDVFARRSGDEFLLLVEGVGDKEDLSQMARKIFDAFKKPVQFDRFEIFISLSIGISIYPKDAKNPEELLHFADIAMYQAKRNGKNNFCFF